MNASRKDSIRGNMQRQDVEQRTNDTQKMKTKEENLKTGNKTQMKDDKMTPTQHNGRVQGDETIHNEDT